MKTRRFTIGIAVAIAALAVAVPVAGAGNTTVDDYWRDQATLTTKAHDTIVDDYFRDAPRAQPQTPNTIVDDYFRDAPVVVGAANGGFDWADFGIGIAVAVGAMLVLAGLGAALLVVRQGRSHRPQSTGTV
ncbi:MAG TPA: hypothetical protein VFK76_10185 [Gaiellaceae bacterium]|nr:hypothetical protein [Gaiellaceae bacterium]